MIKNNITIVLFVISFILCFSNCTKEEEEPAGGEINFQSLVAEQDTIAPGETTIIKATASGNQLEYHWSASLGDILGSGAEVVYAASPCQVGTNKISCKITSGRTHSETKTIDIVVYE